jgi:predicted ATPase
MVTQPPNGQQYGPGITRIGVTGFKSLVEKTEVEIRPLTILAGANSSGKSSLMQPLLLMKQTLEAQFDPGSLAINGANVKFTSASQFLSRGLRGDQPATALIVEVEIGQETTHITFAKADNAPIQIAEMTRRNAGVTAIGGYTYRATWQVKVGDSKKELEAAFEAQRAGGPPLLQHFERVEYSVLRDRCFLVAEASFYSSESGSSPVYVKTLERPWHLSDRIARIIHLSGLRGSPERTSAFVPIGNTFQGLFENYAASIIHTWIRDGEAAKLKGLNESLARIGLQSNVSTEEIDETQVSVSVSRNLDSGAVDRVNIADVGLAVSQILPVLTALIAAEPGQLVYIEQPELHLHPNAQWRLAQLLADAANRGVRLVIETHSSLLLQGILTCVAKGAISPEKVALHWFERNEEGITRVKTANLDSEGRVGDWPADFDNVELRATNDYLDAVEAKLMAAKGAA